MRSAVPFLLVVVLWQFVVGGIDGRNRHVVHDIPDRKEGSDKTAIEHAHVDTETNPDSTDVGTDEHSHMPKPPPKSQRSRPQPLNKSKDEPTELKNNPLMVEAAKRKKGSRENTKTKKNHMLRQKRNAKPTLNKTQLANKLKAMGAERYKREVKRRNIVQKTKK